MSCELEPLRLSARKRRHGLAQLQVFETDVGQRLQHRENFSLIGEKCDCFGDRHVEHVGYRSTGLGSFTQERNLEHFVAVALASIVGAVIGAVLLVLTPERVFSALVPLLLGFATVLFAYAGRISTWLAARAATRGHARRFTHSPAVVLPVSVYGGYFGAGVGVLMLGVLSVGTAGNYRSANVTKNLVTELNSATATVIFAAQGVVSWPATLLMMAGTLVGGLIGARLAQVMPNHAARTLVVFVGALLTAVFAWRYWF